MPVLLLHPPHPLLLYPLLITFPLLGGPAVLVLLGLLPRDALLIGAHRVVDVLLHILHAALDAIAPLLLGRHGSLPSLGGSHG